MIYRTIQQMPLPYTSRNIRERHKPYPAGIFYIK